MKIKQVILISLFASSCSLNALAAMMTNKIEGVGPKNQTIKPWICIQNGNGQVTAALKPCEKNQCESVDANKASGNDYYAGATLRFNGCDSSNTYLGYVGFLINAKRDNKIQAYTPPEGVHVAWINNAINAQGEVTGKISYTPITPNYQLLANKPKQNSNWDFVGINLSGLEFGKVIDPVVIPNLSQEDAATKNSDLSDTQAFLQAGMNTVRIPISWGYLQLEGPGKGELNLEYFNSYIKPLLETITNAGVYAMVDLHAYMRYSVFGKEYSGCGSDGKCPDGTLITDVKAYQDVWTKLYAMIKADNKINMDYLMLDLMNEPVEVPNDYVFTIQAQVIKSLRQQGYQGYILVEGNSWSGLHSWTTASWKSEDGKQTYTNASLFTRDNFMKAGINDLSKIIINVHQYLDSNYSGTQDQCVTDLSTQGPNGFNLNLFRDYLQQNRLKAIVTEFGGGRDKSSCSIAMTKFLNYLKDNSAKNKDYGFVGWTIWSTGHGWGDYNLRVTPISYHMQVLQNYLN